MFNKKWNENHRLNWKSELELKNDGYSGFQLKFMKELKILFDLNSIEYVEEVSKHIDLFDSNKIVKMIVITLKNYPESQLWIYHDMAEYDITKNHAIFEEWGYISPVELREKFVNSLREVLKIN